MTNENGTWLLTEAEEWIVGQATGGLSSEEVAEFRREFVQRLARPSGLYEEVLAAADLRVTRAVCGALGAPSGRVGSYAAAHIHAEMARPVRAGQYVTVADLKQHLAEGETHAAYASRLRIEVRRQREAPLVALVNTVPSWAHPVAWRAAVLAVEEGAATPGAGAAKWAVYGCHRVLASVIGYQTMREDEIGNEWAAKAYRAYRRALQHHKAPPPERKRSSGLPCDVDYE